MNFRNGATIVKTREFKVLGQYWPVSDKQDCSYNAEKPNGEKRIFRTWKHALAWIQQDNPSKSANELQLEKLREENE